MSNTWFQFHQFRVEQDRCAMKITTDACIQGAWAPIAPHVQHVLDIGTGTGLLALMIAQRNTTVTIDAIEFDEAAAIQAKENCAASPWQDRIHLIHGDVKNHINEKKYDMIICNPPFFSDSLLSHKHTKNLARHTVSLSTEELLTAIKANLSPSGYLCILLPYTEYLLFQKAAASLGLHETQALHVKHSPTAPAKRVISIMQHGTTSTPPPQSLIIKNEEGAYTDAFKALLSPFYLNL